MAIKCGTTNVNDVVVRQGTTNYTVTLIQNAAGEVLYARPGTLTYVLSAGASGHGSVERLSTLEPSASTGYVASQQPVYHGDELRIPVAAENYWSGVTYNGTVDLSQSTTHTITLTAYRLTSKGTIIQGENMDSYTITYREGDIAGTTVTLSGVTDTTATYTAWCGASMVITPVASTNFTCDPITKPIGWSNFTETLTGRPWLYPITIPDVANATTRYTYSQGGDPITGTAEGVSVDAWKNQYFEYKWTAATYYKITAGRTDMFRVTQASTVNAPTIEKKVRTINFSNPNKAVILNISYVNTSETPINTTTGTYSNTSSSYVDAWSGRDIAYSPYNSLVPLDSKYFVNDTAGFSATIAAADTESAVNIDATLRTFDLGTYSSSAGTITYYTSSAKTQTISSGTYLDIYNKAYYVFTPPSGWYVKDSGGNYVTQLTGYVTSTPASATSAWYPNIDTTLYGQVTIQNKKRGAVYGIVGSSATKLLGGSLELQATTFYAASGTNLGFFAYYIGSAANLDGDLVATYGTASDSHTTPSNPLTITITQASSTVSFNGTLNMRTIYVNRGAVGGNAAYVMANYINSNGVATNTLIVSEGLSGAITVPSYRGSFSQWIGSDVTLYPDVLPNGWTIVSGYNTNTIPASTSTAATTITYSATYDYAIGYGNGTRTSLSFTYTISNIPTTYSYSGEMINRSGTTLTLTSPATQVGNFKTGLMSVSAASGALTVYNNGFVNSSFMEVYSTIPPVPNCVQTSSTKLTILNPADKNMIIDYNIISKNTITISGTTVAIAGGYSTITVQAPYTGTITVTTAAWSYSRQISKAS